DQACRMLRHSTTSAPCRIRHQLRHGEIREELSNIRRKVSKPVRPPWVAIRTSGFGGACAFERLLLLAGEIRGPPVIPRDTEFLDSGLQGGTFQAESGSRAIGTAKHTAGFPKDPDDALTIPVVSRRYGRRWSNTHRGRLDFRQRNL